MDSLALVWDTEQARRRERGLSTAGGTCGRASPHSLPRPDMSVPPSLDRLRVNHGAIAKREAWCIPHGCRPRRRGRDAEASLSRSAERPGGTAKEKGSGGTSGQRGAGRRGMSAPSASSRGWGRSSARRTGTSWRPCWICTTRPVKRMVHAADAFSRSSSPHAHAQTGRAVPDAAVGPSPESDESASSDDEEDAAVRNPSTRRGERLTHAQTGPTLGGAAASHARRARSRCRAAPRGSSRRCLQAGAGRHCVRAQLPAADENLTLPHGRACSQLGGDADDVPADAEHEEQDDPPLDAELEVPQADGGADGASEDEEKEDAIEIASSPAAAVRPITRRRLSSPQLTAPPPSSPFSPLGMRSPAVASPAPRGTPAGSARAAAAHGSAERYCIQKLLQSTEENGVPGYYALITKSGHERHHFVSASVRRASARWGLTGRCASCAEAPRKGGTQP
jgi:hypothetical protein